MKLYNIVKVYTSTVGTGTVTLGSAVPSFITFATAGVITGSTVSYAIEDGNNREVGTGVYTSGAETLTRTVVTSTNSNNAITLSGNAVVFITGLAADLSSDTAATANTLVIRNGSGNFALGTPTSGTLTNCTGLPVSTGISGLGANVATFLATPSSANLASAVTDETGSGALVFGTSPTIATPTITTSATVPLVIGGTGTTSTLTLRSTSGVGTTGADIIFQAGNNGATEVMRLQNGGNVGIGITPVQPFHVYRTTVDSIGTFQGLTTALGGTGKGGIQLDVNGNGGYALLCNATSGTRSFTISGNNGYGSGMTEFMRIDFSGNVGIGTSSPATESTNAKLAVVGSSNQSASTLATSNSNAGFTVRANASSGYQLAVGATSVDGSPYIQGVNFNGGAVASNLTLQGYGGNVGIGTTPSYRLHVSGGRSVFVANSEPYAVGVGYSGGSAYWIGSNSANNALVFSEGGGSEKMRIDSSGNVGIGVTPSNRLHVGGIVQIDQVAGLADLYMGAGTTGNSGKITYDNNNVRFVFSLGASEKMRINSTGNVGIGTTDPLTKLQVGTAAGGVGADGNTTLSAGTLMVYGVATSGAALTWNAYTNGGNTNTVMAQLRPRQDTSANYNLDVFCGTWNNNNTPGTAVATFQSTGNVGIGTSSPQTLLTVGSYTAGTAEATTRGYIQIQDPTESVSLDGNRGLEFKNSPSGSGYGWKMGGVGGVNFAIGNRNNSATFTERMRIDSSGNVGIGTSSTAFNSAGLPLVIGSGSGNTGMTIYSGSSSFGSLHFADTVTTGGGSYSGYINYNHNVNSMQFATDALERMRIDSSGNVGIGTTSVATSAKLEIAGTTGALLVPRLTTTERNALSAVNGMIIYNTTDNEMQGRINGAWVAM